MGCHQSPPVFEVNAKTDGQQHASPETASLAIQHADIELLIKILTLPVAIRTSLEGVIDAFLEQNKT